MKSKNRTFDAIYNTAKKRYDITTAKREIGYYYKDDGLQIVSCGFDANTLREMAEFIEYLQTK
jgi:hypothetical protein